MLFLLFSSSFILSLSQFYIIFPSLTPIYLSLFSIFIIYPHFPLLPFPFHTHFTWLSFCYTKLIPGNKLFFLLYLFVTLFSCCTHSPVHTSLHLPSHTSSVVPIFLIFSFYFLIAFFPFFFFFFVCPHFQRNKPILHRFLLIPYAILSYVHPLLRVLLFLSKFSIIHL